MFMHSESVTLAWTYPYGGTYGGGTRTASEASAVSVMLELRTGFAGVRSELIEQRAVGVCCEVIEEFDVWDWV